MCKPNIFIFVLVVFITLLLLPPPCFSLDLNLDDYDDLFGIKSEKKISMDFIDADLNTVLKVFSQQSGLNFIAGTAVADKKVNLYLEEVPVEQALERILSANNLTYEISPESNIFIVNELKTTDKEMMTRVYPLKHATVPSSKLNSTLDFKNDSSSSSSSKNGILSAIGSVLTKDGSVIEDTRTNSLIVTDYPTQFPLVEQTIARLDVRIPQILIEAEMLEISKETADLLGAKWGNTPIAYTGPTRDTLFPFDQNRAIVDSGKSGGQGFEFTGSEFEVGTLSFEGLELTLQFLRTKTDTRNLARPRILTLNNDTAEISISTDEAIGLGSTTTASEGTAETVAEAERVETGVFLRVTPQANIETREITMAIEPKVIQAKTGGTFDGQTFKDPEERGSKSITRIRDGDTIVIGGLLRTSTDDIRTSVPVLGNIPILGSAFRHKDKNEKQRELIIFITPHILSEDIARIMPSSSKPIVREQSLPAEKRTAIDKELSSMEGRGFDSY